MTQATHELLLPDQAHITAIVVRRDSRGLGLGELLLQKALALAHRLRASKVTLEVRMSSHVALGRGGGGLPLLNPSTASTASPKPACAGATTRTTGRTP